MLLSPEKTSKNMQEISQYGRMTLLGLKIIPWFYPSTMQFVVTVISWQEFTCKFWPASKTYGPVRKAVRHIEQPRGADFSGVKYKYGCGPEQWDRYPLRPFADCVNSTLHWPWLVWLLVLMRGNSGCFTERLCTRRTAGWNNTNKCVCFINPPHPFAVSTWIWMRQDASGSENLLYFGAIWSL